MSTRVNKIKGWVTYFFLIIEFFFLKKDNLKDYLYSLEFIFN